MIHGTVSEDGVPVIELEIAGQRWTAIIDSGFNGDLELPTHLQGKISAQFAGRAKSLLAAGQQIEEDVFLVDLQFDGSLIKAEATFAPANELLIGTNLLRNHRLLVDFPNKTVLVERD